MDGQLDGGSGSQSVGSSVTEDSLAGSIADWRDE